MESQDSAGVGFCVSYPAESYFMEEQKVKQETVLIEQTAKKWKAAKLIGVVLFVIGGVALVVKPNAFTFLILLAGVAIYCYGRFGAWWFHK
jgi:uncharacterized membrane protein HdeD (DUF308 family)